MEENWRDIEGYEGRYQVSDIGNVKSLNYKNRGYAKVLSPKISNRGRMWVQLKCGGKIKNALIHRLVASAFIPNENNEPLVNHKDENPLNNRADNLEWCSASYNTKYSIDRHPERKRRVSNRIRPKGVPYKHKDPIVQFSKDGKEINRFPNIAYVCAMNDWKTSSVLQCCNGERRTAYGYIWRFAN